MKKTLSAILLLGLCLSLGACAPTPDASAAAPTMAPEAAILAATQQAAPEGAAKTLEIGEKMFIAQINDIYYNFDDYKDVSVTVEGMYDLFYGPDDPDDAPSIPVVYRNGPGCCENDGWAGFQLHYKGQYPDRDSWIRVTGRPRLVEKDGYKSLYLYVSDLEVKTERGAAYVAQ